MPKRIKPLSAAQVLNSRAHGPGDAGRRKLFDGGGLYLEVREPSSSGEVSRRWMLSYRAAGGKHVVGVGSFPDVSLADARKARAALRDAIARGGHPALEAREKKREATATAAAGLSLNDFAATWLAVRAKTWAPATTKRNKFLLDVYVKPRLGRMPLRDITKADVLAALQVPLNKGRAETSHRLYELLRRLFAHAIDTGARDSGNPCAFAKVEALGSATPTARAALTDPKEVGALLRAIDAYAGRELTRYALLLTAYTFTRPSEARGARWSEFDLDAATWDIPAERMKARRPHHVPLSRQVVELLRELHTKTGDSALLFPSVRDAKRPMSEVTVLAAIRRMGYTKAEMSAHGFRAVASTLLHESLSYQPAVIEAQLAHREASSVSARYDRATYLDERKKMMAAYADLLDRLRAEKPAPDNVIPFPAKSA